MHNDNCLKLIQLYELLWYAKMQITTTENLKRVPAKKSNLMSCNSWWFPYWALFRYISFNHHRCFRLFIRFLFFKSSLHVIHPPRAAQVGLKMKSSGRARQPREMDTPLYITDTNSKFSQDSRWNRSNATNFMSKAHNL